MMNEEELKNTIKEIRLKIREAIERCIDKDTTQAVKLLIAESIIDVYFDGEIEDALFCLKRARGILDCSMEDKDVHAKRIIDAFLRERENES